MSENGHSKKKAMAGRDRYVRTVGDRSRWPVSVQDVGGEGELSPHGPCGTEAGPRGENSRREKRLQSEDDSQWKRGTNSEYENVGKQVFENI